MTTRIHNWQSRFAAVIAERHDQPWVRGPVFDCCGFAGACVLAITGADPLARWGAWSTTKEALRIIQQHGSLRAAVGTQLGAEIPVEMAQPGDVGIFADLEGDGLAVWGGNDWLAPGSTGLASIKPELIEAAWRCTGESAHG